MVDYTEYQLRFGTESVASASGEVISPAEMVLIVNSDGVPVALRIGHVTIPTAVRDLPNWNKYTDFEKSKLSGIEVGAQVNTVVSVHGRTGTVIGVSGDYDADKITETASNKLMTAAERSKLSGLPSSFSGETFQTTWDASTNTPTLAGTGMTPGQWWQVTASGTQFSKTFTAGTHRALVDTAGVLQPVLIGTGAVTSVYTRTGAIVATSGDYSADQVTESGTRVFVTPAQKTHIDALPATAAPLSHVGTGGAEHPLATQTVAGFQSADDKINADLFGFAVAEIQPTVPNGCYWYQPSSGRMRRYDSGIPRFWIVITKETTSPTVANDDIAGFDDGCMWVDVTGRVVWFCLDNSTGAAVWQQVVTPSAVSLGGTSIVASPGTGGGLQFKGLAVAGTSGDPAITSDGTTVTISTPTRPTGAEIVSLVDAQFGSTDWHAGAASVQTESVPFLWIGNTLPWTDQPAATTEFGGAEFRVVRDLSNALTLQFSRTVDGTFGASGSKLWMEYSVDNQSTWTKITGTDLAIDGAAVILATSYVDVPALAKTTSTWLRVMASGGDGVIDPRIRDLITTITFPMTTTSGVRSNTFVSHVNIYTGTNGFTVPSPDAEFAVRNRAFVDLTCATEMQYSLECIAAATLATTRFYIQYSVDGGSTWVTIPGTEVTLNVVGTRTSGWAVVPDGAKQAGAMIRSFGGNVSTAGQTTTVRTGLVSIRKKTFTPLLVPASSGCWSPLTIIQYNSIWQVIPVGTAQEVFSRLRFPVDTQNVTNIRLFLHVLAAGKAGTVGYLQYSLDLGTTWVTIPGTSLALDSTGRKDSTSVSLPSGAVSTSCIMRLAGDNPASPAGTTNVTFGICIIDLKYSIAAVAPWGSVSQVTLPPQTVTASNQLIVSDRVFIEGTASALTLPAANSGIDTCDMYVNKSSLCNIVPVGGEAIDGVGVGGVDIMPFKWLKLVRRTSGAVTWFER